MACVHFNIPELFCFSGQIQASPLKFPLVMIIFMLGLTPAVMAQTSVKNFRGAIPLIPLTAEPPAKLFVDPPLPEQLSRGLMVVQYRTENLHIVPVYGPAALDVSPRIGHLHITFDGAPWHWVDASNEPIILKGVPPGQHQLLIELADPTHKVIDSKLVKFIVPAH